MDNNLLRKKRERNADPGVKPLEKKFDGQTIGLVIYGDDSFYSNMPAENGDLHINISKEQVGSKCINYLQELTSKIVESGIIGHEHGSINKKCHYQCAFKFSSRICRDIKPFSFDVEGTRLLCMAQSIRNPHAIWNYCQKEDTDPWTFGKFSQQAPDWHSIAENESLSQDDLVNALVQVDPKHFLTFGDRIIKNYTSLIQSPNIPPFQWTFPEHLTQVVFNVPKQTEVLFRNSIIRIRHWFESFCLKDHIRRQALFIASEDRGLGKTEFAKRLVPHDAYFIYCRANLRGQEFETKEKTAKLIILDDISFVDGDKEMWKALISGEPVIIRTAYCNISWKGGLPCIVLTNSKSTANYWLRSQEFRTQCLFENARTYLGPIGTKPDFLGTIHNNFDSDFMYDLDQEETKAIARRDRFKN
ncbi:MAG: hypothetical protein ACRYGG_11430 [Janthinobacterium lividum]